LKQISSTNDFVCGVNSDDNIFCTNNCDEVPTWKHLAGKLKYVSVNNKGNLWGVNKADAIFFCSSWKNCNWIHVGGLLKQISSTNDTVCGVNAANNIFCSKFVGAAVTWQLIPGLLKHVTVNNDGSLFGTNAIDEIFYCKNWQNCNWTKLPGALKQIDSTGNTVCGVNSSDKIFCSEY
jgi:hypothetical protein